MSSKIANVKSKEKNQNNNKVERVKSKSSNNKENKSDKNVKDNRSKHDSDSKSTGIIAQTAKSGSFALQTKIMIFLKNRHLEKEFNFLSVNEIISQIKETPPKDIVDHLDKFFKSNFKIEEENGCYRFKPSYDIKSRRELLNLIQKRSEMGFLVAQDDVLESYKVAEKSIKRLLTEKKIVSFETKRERKVILMYNFDSMPIEDDIDRFTNLLNTIKVDSFEIETYDRNSKKRITTDGSDVKTFKKPTVQKNRKQRKAVIRTNAAVAHLLN